MSRFVNYPPALRVMIPDGNDQMLTGEVNGRRFALNTGLDQVTPLSVAIADLKAGNVALNDEATGGRRT